MRAANTARDPLLAGRSPRLPCWSCSFDRAIPGTDQVKPVAETPARSCSTELIQRSAHSSLDSPDRTSLAVKIGPGDRPGGLPVRVRCSERGLGRCRDPTFGRDLVAVRERPRTDLRGGRGGTSKRARDR